MINCLESGAPAEQVRDAFGAIRRAGRVVNVGGVGKACPLGHFNLMYGGIDVLGSDWFNVAEDNEMAALVEAGLLNLSCYEHRRYSLDAVNDLISSIPDRHLTRPCLTRMVFDFRKDSARVP